MTAALVVVVAFCAMEAVSYATHRWVMHGPGMVWHRSHHRPPTGPVEANDLFPLCFSVAGVACFALASWGPALGALWWVGTGMTAYGATYLAVHELVIHRRLAVPVPRWGYLCWLRDSHRIHHLYGGEPYGMLLPVVPRALRARAAASPRQPLDREVSPA